MLKYNGCLIDLKLSNSFIKYNYTEMTLNELAAALADMYHNAPKGEAVAMIHLFGIKYANELQQSKFSKKDIARAARIPESYGTEISKGIKLAPYVTVKENN